MRTRLGRRARARWRKLSPARRKRLLSISAMVAMVGAYAYVTEPPADAGVAPATLAGAPNATQVSEARAALVASVGGTVAARPAVPPPSAARRIAQAPLDAPAIRLPGDPAVPLLASARSAPAQPPAAPSCAPSLSAAPVPGGRIAMSLARPCTPGAAAEIAMGPIRFSVALDGQGGWAGHVPALSPLVELTARTGTAEARASVMVPDAAALTRVALQWQGPAALGIHAMEFGADHGDPGHVWAGAPGAILASGTAAQGGFLARLGDAEAGEGHQAEIYALPRSTARRGTVRLVVEAEVTSATCGRAVAAEALQPGPEGALAPVALRLEMPGCEAIGDILVLKNLLHDLRIAGKD